MEEPRVFMMHGVTAAGKTETSLALERTLGIIRLSTCQLKAEMGMEGRTQDYDLRDRAYAELVRRLENGLDEGKSFVLDGTFALRRWRRSVYEVCLKRQVPLCVVVCLCEDQEEIRRRLAARQRIRAQTPDEEADRFEYWATEKQGIEEVLGDELPVGERLQLMVVDTFRRRVLGYVVAADQRTAAPRELGNVLGFGS